MILGMRQSGRNLGIACCCFVSSLLIAGGRIEAQYSELVEVSVANIDVVVTDADGNVVRGLTKDDFELYESGKLQAITNFSAIDLSRDEPVVPRDEPISPRNETRKESLPRLIVLFVDIGDIEPARRVKFFDGVRGFVSEAFREGDVVSVLFWNHRVRIGLAPTSDKRQVDAVIDTLGTPFGVADQALSTRLAETRAEQTVSEAALSGPLGLATLSDMSAEREFLDFTSSEERCAEIRRKANELRNLMLSFSRVEMQKILIFASDDFSLGPRGPTGGGTYRPRSCRTRGEIDLLADTANAYGVTIHSFHPPGPRNDGADADRVKYAPAANDPSPLAAAYFRSFDEAGGLEVLAKRTGGLSGSGPLQSGRMLQQVARELDVYYSLGYRVGVRGDDKSRSVKVATKNRRYRVRARQSVVHLSESSRLRDLVTTNLYLPEQTAPQTPSFEARLTKTTRDGRFLLADVEVSIRSGDLVLLPSSQQKRKGSFSVFLAAGRELGDASDVNEMKQEFETAAQAEDESRVTYSFTTRIRPDTRRLSIAVRDNVSGSVATKIVALAPGPKPAP